MDECQCVIPKQAFTFFRIRFVRLLCSGRLAVCTERDGPFVGEEREGTGGPFSCVQSEVARTKECVPGVRTRANGKCIFDAVPKQIKRKFPPLMSDKAFTGSLLDKCGYSYLHKAY